MSDPQTLLTNAKCFLCLGVSLAEALQLALLDQVVSGGGSVGESTFESALFPISDNPWPAAFGPTPYLKVAHGLGEVPAFLRAVWVCTTNDADWGLVAGQEMPIESIYQTDADVGDLITPLQIWADAINIYACPLELTLVTGNEGLFLTTTGLGITGGGLDTPTSLGHFAVKFYAEL